MTWPQRHLRLSLEALGDLAPPFLAFVDRPSAMPADAPPGTWKVLVEDGPLGRGALVLDTWEGDALAGAILRLVQTLPDAYDLDAAGRVHLGVPGRFVRGFGFLLREGAPPLLRFELREREPGAGVCAVGTALGKQRDLDRDRPVGPELRARSALIASRIEVWIPPGGRPWLGAVVGDERISDDPGGAWVAERGDGFEAWPLPTGVQRVRALG
jgi:hypothetical protein